MDAADVIVLDDSDSSDGGRGASGCTSAAASPAARKPAYTNAVEVALAMAAALQTANASKKTKKKAAPLAPPLASHKPKPSEEARPALDERQQVRRQEFSAAYRQSWVATPAKKKDTSRDKSPSQGGEPLRARSISKPSSTPCDRRVNEHHTPRRPADKHKKKGVDARVRGARTHSDAQRKALSKPKTHVRARSPVEVVDLRSSSGSSEASSSGRSRSSSMSSSLSSSSSDSDVRMEATATTNKKRLVLNDRVPGTLPRRLQNKKTVGRSNTSGGRQHYSSYADDATTDEEVTVTRVTTGSAVKRKRKRVVAQKRPEVHHDGNNGNKREMGVRVQVPKKNRTKSSVNGVRLQTPAAKRRSPVENDSSSSSYSSSEDDMPPRPAVARSSSKVAQNTPATSTEVPTPQTKSMDRKRGGKSTPASPDRFHRRSPSTSSPDSVSSSRKKRRTYSYFNTDSVALDDIQAQERELAWIQAQHKSRARTPNPSTHKRKTCREVIDVDGHSDSNSAVDRAVNRTNCFHYDNQRAKSATPVSRSAATAFSNVVFHPTAYRNIYLREAPDNVLWIPIRKCRAPFEWNCDQSLTYFDTSNSLKGQCGILTSFGKSTPCLTSVFPGESAKSQSDTTQAVSSLISEYLPTIRHCHREKVQAILKESRQKVAVYRSALAKHARNQQCANVEPRVLNRSIREKRVAKLLKTEKLGDNGTVSFEICRGEGLAQQKTVPALVSKKVLSLRPYTTSIGLHASYRVDDDPILRYTATTRPSGVENASEDCVKKYGLSIKNAADEEVIEYVLRLVVARLGDSEQVFNALRSELDFSQAYTVYGELKKLHDSRERTRGRLRLVEELLENTEATEALDIEVNALANLMKHSSLSANPKKNNRRLRPPLSSFESNIVDSLIDGATTSLAALGLRSTDNYSDMVDVYGAFLCRLCYQYGCHEHGGEHPLPSRRVDPAYPSVQFAPPAAIANTAIGDDLIELSDDDVICVSSSESAAPAPKALLDPSEFVDASYVTSVASKMRTFISDTEACGDRCWKRTASREQQDPELSAAEQGIVRKLRETMGDNSCVLAAVLGSAPCVTVHAFIDKEDSSTNSLYRAGDASGRSKRQQRSWKHSRRSGGSNHELVQRTRDHRLQDRGTSNHEYKPCLHDGMCDSTGCSCMKRDHMCEKACACSRDCPNRFEGCSCAPGSCRTDKCPCFVALRECNPDVCLSCGASDLAIAASSPAVRGAHARCDNMNVTRKKHKKLAMSFSDIHGWGVYAQEPIAAGDFVYEYTGAMLSQDEAERRGAIYDKMVMSYLFDLNEDAVLDALRCGNKSKFINHDGVAPNCSSKILSVSGIHHISIWAIRGITKGEELVFDYGYKKDVGPAWSHRRVTS